MRLHNGPIWERLGPLGLCSLIGVDDAAAGVAAASVAPALGPAAPIALAVLGIRSIANKIQQGHYKQDTSKAQQETTDLFKQLDQQLQQARQAGTVTDEELQEAQNSALNAWNGLAKFLSEKGSAGAAGLKTMSWVPQFLTDLGLSAQQINQASQGQLDPNNAGRGQNIISPLNLAPNAPNEQINLAPNGTDNMATAFTDPGQVREIPRSGTWPGAGPGPWWDTSGVNLGSVFTINLGNGLTAEVNRNTGDTTVKQNGQTQGKYPQGQTPNWLKTALAGVAGLPRWTQTLLGIGAGAVGGLANPESRFLAPWESRLNTQYDVATNNASKSRQGLQDWIDQKQQTPGYTSDEASGMMLAPNGFELNTEGLQLTPEEQQNRLLQGQTAAQEFLTPEEQNNMLLSPQARQRILLSPESRSNAFVSPEARTALQLTGDEQRGAYETQAEQLAQDYTPEEIQKMLFTEKDKTAAANLATAPIAGAADKAMTSLTSAAAARGGYAPGLNATAELISERAGQQSAAAELASNLASDAYNRDVERAIARHRTDTAANLAQNRQATEQFLALNRQQQAKMLGLNDQQTRQFLMLDDQAVARFIATNDQSQASLMALNRQGTTQRQDIFNAQQAANIAENRQRTQLTENLNKQQTDLTTAEWNAQMQQRIADARMRGDEQTAQQLQAMMLADQRSQQTAAGIGLQAGAYGAPSAGNRILGGAASGLQTTPPATTVATTPRTTPGGVVPPVGTTVDTTRGGETGTVTQTPPAPPPSPQGFTTTQKWNGGGGYRTESQPSGYFGSPQGTYAGAYRPQNFLNKKRLAA